MPHIDLNADLGEGHGQDAALMALVSSCNIACGGHAGDAVSMRATLALAADAGVVVGAHPSYPDREGFGRRSRFLEGEPLRESLVEQVDCLEQLASEAGMTLRHMKPHGALYNDADLDPGLSDLVASVAKQQGLVLVGPPAGELAGAASRRGLGYCAEGFVDRAYTASGHLLPRCEEGAVFSDVSQAVEQALSLVVRQRVRSVEGDTIAMSVGTLCLHSDTPNAVAVATAIRRAFSKYDIIVEPPGEPSA